MKPTSKGRRALAACLLVLVAWLLAVATPAGADDTVPLAPVDTAAPLDNTVPLDTTTTVVAAPDPPVVAAPDPPIVDPPGAPTETTTTDPPPVTTITPAAPKTTTATRARNGAVASTTTTTATTAPVRAADATPAAGSSAAAPVGGADSKASVSLDLGGVGGKPSQSLMIIVLITLLSVAPALLIMMTSFTRIVIVLSLTRNALGLHTIPPNQVIVGLAMFLSFFVMSPTFSDINKDAVQPLLHGQKTQAQAYDSAVTPLRTFMLKQTRKGELAMFSSAANGGKRPAKPEDVGLAALIPAFILSELKTAFIIGFVVFIPFLVIDIVVSSSLMSMGMMMLPPVFVSLPFKLLLFVMVDGWGLIVRSLLKSFA
ncbi:MAG: flagellar biosynthesis protein FliP [Actinomycetota bacterium]|nr:flagellar biosynthesis protein FliP [Actinomycetota bacterium]